MTMSSVIMCYVIVLIFHHTVKTHKGKSKGNSPVTSVHISPIKFKYYILNKERLKRSYQASDFLPETEISPSHFEN